MLANVHTRTWCDCVFLRCRKEIAQAIRNHVRPRCLTTAKGLRKTFDEFYAAFGAGLCNRWRNHGGEFLYVLVSYDHEQYLEALLAVMAILHQRPYRYQVTGDKIVELEKGELSPCPVDEAYLMNFAISFKAIIEELRELKQEAERGAKMAA